jgi:signal transduction histidine kinase
VVVLLGCLAVGGLFLDDIGKNADREPDPVGVILAVMCVVPLLWRSSNSLRVLIATTLPLLALASLQYESAGASLGQIIAMYSAAVSRPRIPATFALLFAEATTITWLTLRDAPAGVLNVIANVAALFAVWAFARSVGFRRAYTAELEAHAARLEITRETDMRAAVAEERARIARELHDVVAHHVSVMTVQASAAGRILTRNPDRAKEAMSAVESTGRAALVEMRRLVGVLRSDEPNADKTAGGQHTPAPGLDQLDVLVGQVRDAGLAVELAIEGVPCELPQGIDLAAYRIVQEALTNTLKHAGPAGAWVLLRYDLTDLHIRITDDGAEPQLSPSQRADAGKRYGHGLVGMRERVALYGGDIHTGRHPDGGFEVRARIPLTANDRTEPGAERLEQSRP